MEMEKFSDSLSPFTNDIENPVLQDSLKSLKELNNNNLTILDWGNDRIAIPMEIVIDLPSLGNFENLDIRETEPVILVFDLLNYPVSAPRVHTDRIDFPKNNLAHLYIAVNNRPPAFCYVRGNPEEWYANKRIEDLIIRIKNWLKDAATGELSENGEQYEPLRLEGYLGNIIYDYDTILNIIPEGIPFEFNKKHIVTLFERSTLSGYTFKFIKHITDENITSTIKEVNEEKEKESEDITKKKLYYTYILWNDENDTQKEYEVNIPSSWEEFKIFCEFYNIKYEEFEKFISTFNHLNEDGYFPVIIGIHRPKQLIGYSSNIEFVNLLFKIGPNDIKNERVINNIAIHMLSHNQPLTYNLASKISGRKVNLKAGNRNVVFGCGALGSKIIMHFARSGQSNLTLIDPDNISPHNLVRHSLFGDSVGENKAKALSEKIKELYPYELQLVTGSHAFKDGAIDKKETFEIYKWLFDFTASEAFFNKLVLMKSIDNTNVCSASISDFGNLGIMYIEGKERNPRIDDLQVYLYSLSENNEEIKNWLNSEQFAMSSNNLTVQVGVGCNSETTILSDDKIASHAAYFSGALKKEIDESKLGRIYLNRIKDADDYSIQSQVINVSPFKTFLAINDESWEIRFKDGIVEELLLNFKNNKNETGGVFVGICNYKTKTIHITGTITAPKDSKANHSQFIRGHAGLADKISDIESKSGGQIGYIGEWHTHPNGPNSLSNQDMVSVEKHKKECSRLIPPLPVFLTIITPDGLLPYIF
jgi:hypothetical protein